MSVNFDHEVSLSYFNGSLTCRKILRHGADGFTSSPKELVLRIFIDLKNTSSSAGCEPANLGDNDRHNNHWTTEGDKNCFSFKYQLLDTELFNPLIRTLMTVLLVVGDR
jgi:hypothetical protein